MSLGRLFIYIKNSSLKRPEVREFVNYYMRSPETVRAAKYVPLNNFQLSKERGKLDKALKVVELVYGGELFRSCARPAGQPLE